MSEQAAVDRVGEATEPIDVRAVVKRFGALARPALDGATFVVRSGRRACLLGPNGAGKTTLIRILTGALAPTSGEARVFGATPGSAAWNVSRRRVGVVPQLPGMYRDLTAREYLELVRGVYERGDVDEAAKKLGLTRKHLRRSMAELSGGWQRRLTLAAALLCEPDLVVLDEPTVGLDPVAAREVIAMLREATAGRTALLCTHNLAEAEALCDDVVVLRDGKVVLDDSIDELRRRAPAHVAIGVREGAALAASALSELGLDAKPDGDRAVFLASDPEARLPPIVKALVERGLSVFECIATPPTLEELFLQAVQKDQDRAPKASVAQGEARPS
jgi:ABC-2 type transport system ATP-binding protein